MQIGKKVDHGNPQNCVSMALIEMNLCYIINKHEVRIFT